MKKHLLALLIVFFGNGLMVNDILAGQAFSVTGVVDSINRKSDRIKVDGKKYRLHREIIVEDKYYLREVEPVIKKGDNVELVFTTSSLKSGVREIWLLRETKK